MRIKNYTDPKATVPGRKYDSYKPKSCNYCYYWKNKHVGCTLEECYYLLPKEKQVEAKRSECDGCPYEEHEPCIGSCIKKILSEMKE